MSYTIDNLDEDDRFVADNMDYLDDLKTHGEEDNDDMEIPSYE